ncbi:MAG TPA: hypothetical protein VGL89_06600 [Candidatus Koribacter sp.]|jgi:hypothetical protein
MLHLLLPFAALALVGAPQGQSAAPQAVPVTNDPITLTRSAGDAAQPVCYKMRTYIFERNDGAAPILVRATTCPLVHPRVNRANTRARIIPAN